MALKNGTLLVFQSFKRDKVLRIFKLSSGQDDHAIMFMDDYLKQVCLSPGSALIGSLGDSNCSMNLLSYTPSGTVCKVLVQFEKCPSC